jgi:hypothetical protein
MKIRQGIGIVATFLLMGCGNTYPVSGKITYADGTPMTGGGQITFTPLDPQNKQSARGMIREDGSFQMGTHGDADGVLQGKYGVAIVPTPPKNPNRPPPGWPPLQKKYMNHKTSELEYTVTRGRNQYDITVSK